MSATSRPALGWTASILAHLIVLAVVAHGVRNLLAQTPPPAPLPLLPVARIAVLPQEGGPQEEPAEAPLPGIEVARAEGQAEDVPWRFEPAPPDHPVEDWSAVAVAGADPGAGEVIGGDGAGISVRSRGGAPVRGGSATAVAGGAWTPVVLASRRPRYPELARRLGRQGTVVLELALSPDGAVAEVGVSSSSGVDELDQAAVDAVRTWRFSPHPGVAAGHRDRLRTSIVFSLVPARL
jgi:protein TonB